MRIALFLTCLAACSDEEDRIAADKQRQRLVEARNSRWELTYVPYIEAACAPDPEALQCARARLDAQRMFQEDEARLAQQQASAAAPPRKRGLKCVTIGVITKCKER